MKTINIFIASSATSELLSKQKEALAKKCRELNIEFADEGKDYYINPIAYDDLERRMEVFENHIKNDDIVVFLIDGTKDPNLEEKLKVAAEEYRAGSKPELLVFVSNKINEEYEQKIKDILKTKGWLYENLDSHNDFLTNVENRIKGYIAQYDEKIKQKKQKKRWYWGIGAIIAVLAVVCIGLILKNRSLNSKRLLIVGGGSACNYIEKKYLNNDSLVKLKPDLWWYAPMPSADSYRIIAEEIINFNENYKTRPYYPIVISAAKAKNDSSFNKNNSIPDFRNKAVVVGIHLGDESLVVYSSSRDRLDSAFIDCSKLEKLIKDTTLVILRTSVTSGTFNTYIDSVCSILKNKQGLKFFSDSDILLEHYDGKEWIALGSEYYCPKGKDVVNATVYKNTGIVKKPIYIYFLLYKDKYTAMYILPDATKDFLKKLGVSKSGIQIIESVNYSIKYNTDRILYDTFILDSLKN